MYFGRVVVFIGHCLNYYGLTAAMFTHRYVEFVECVPKWCMRSHTHTAKQFQTNNPIWEFSDGNMQPNQRHRQATTKMLGPISNGFHLICCHHMITNQILYFRCGTLYEHVHNSAHKSWPPEVTLWNCRRSTLLGTALRSDGNYREFLFKFQITESLSSHSTKIILMNW